MSKRKQVKALAKTDRALPKLMLPAIPKTLPDYPEFTKAQLAARLDETSDFANVKVRTASIAHEEIADHVFRDWYLNSPRLAFDDRVPPPPGIKELLARAGKSLHLVPYELRRGVKAAAMNHHVRDPRWVNLPWVYKIELVRLVSDPDDLKLFEAGVLFANKPNLGIDAVRNWVNNHVARADRSPGRPRALTVSGGVKLATTGLRLGDEAERGRFVTSLLKIDDERRTQMLGDLEKTVENLKKVLAETRRQLAKRPPT